jgi:exosortase/archaeosortase family protein
MSEKKRRRKIQNEAPSFRVRSWLKDRREVLQYAFIFGVVISVCSIMLQTEIVSQLVVVPHLNYVASVCGTLLNFLGTTCAVQASSIMSSRFNVQVIEGCDSLYPTVFLTAAIFAFPSRWKMRMAGAAIGAVLLFILNIVRVVMMFYAGTYIPSLFDILHLYAWQALFTLMTFGYYLFWLVHVVKANVHKAL